MLLALPVPATAVDRLLPPRQLSAGTAGSGMPVELNVPAVDADGGRYFKTERQRLRLGGDMPALQADGQALGFQFVPYLLHCGARVGVRFPTAGADRKSVV